MDLTASYRDYVEHNLNRIIDDAFLAFGSSSILTHIPNNKGKAIIGKSEVGEDIVQKWKELNINDGRQSVDFDNIELDSFRAQFHERYVPEKLENSYYGYLRQSGQDPEDFPFQAYVIMLLTKALLKWHEKNLWQAVKDDASDSGSALFDGLLKQVTDGVTNGDIIPMNFGTPYKPRSKDESIPAGFTSIIDIVEDMYNNGIPDEWKEMGVNVYMNTKFKTMYNQAYRNVHGTHPTTAKMFDIDRHIIDGSEDNPAYILGVGGMSGSNRIVMTPRQNAVYTYDVENDKSTFNFQYILNVLHIFGAFRLNAKFMLINNDWMAINELA